MSTATTSTDSHVVPTATATATLTSNTPLLTCRTVTCEQCGQPLALSARGRPRRYCLTCRPRWYTRKVAP